MGCNITFIGELYIRALLRPMIVHLVIRSLLEEDNEGKPVFPLASHSFIF